MYNIITIMIIISTESKIPLIDTNKHISVTLLARSYEKASYAMIYVK